MDALAHQTNDYAHGSTQQSAIPQSANDDQTPLVVNLEGTLIKTDLLFESVLSLIKRNPVFVLFLPLWLLTGKANLKHQVARRTQIDVRLLPYAESLVEFLTCEHQRGRQLILVTGADELLANDVAEYLGIFSAVLASNGQRSLSRDDRREQVLERYQPGSFDYVGSEPGDLTFWRAARRCHSVSISEKQQNRIKRDVVLDRQFESPRQVLRPLIKAIRPHQWSKNLLVLAPGLAAHLYLTHSLIGASILAFIAFSLAASSAYVLNDMLDLEADRRHPRKCKRPFASGAVPLSRGLWLSPLLLIASVTIALHLPPQFLLVLACYLVLTLAYSFYLKRVVLLDAITLSGLYGVRILAGAAAIGITASSSMLAFSLFIFLSLAMLKRYTELENARSADGRVVKLRAYEGEDKLLLLALGGASGYLSVAVLAQYINTETARSLYSTPDAMWLACPLLLYWISHAWLLAHRGQMNDDPVVFAATNRTSQIVIALIAITFLFAV